MSAQLAQAPRSTLWIDYDNDTGSGDEGLLEWWSVIDESTGDALCKCDDEATAKRILAALEAFEAAPQQEPVAWQVWWGMGEMRLNSVHIKKATADEVASRIKSYTEVRPVYAAPQQAQAPGWQLVPVEPTPEMLAAVVTSLDEHLLGREAEQQYREDWAAMLSAAPQQGSKS